MKLPTLRLTQLTAISVCQDLIMQELQMTKHTLYCHKNSNMSHSCAEDVENIYKKSML